MTTPCPTTLDYNSQSMQQVITRHEYRRMAFIMVGLLVLLVLILVFVPIQQTITGIGRVTVFSPMERPQTIEAQIPARIEAWHVVEGQPVKKGQLIAELRDVDAKFLDLEQPERLKRQLDILVMRRDAALARASSLESQYGALSQSRNVAIPTAGERNKQARDRLLQAEQAYQAAQQNVTTTRLNLGRINELYSKGLRSKRDLELAELDAVRAKTDEERARAGFEVARKDTLVAGFDQTKVVADTAASLSGVQASLASARESVASYNSDIIKLEVDLENLKNRVEQRMIRAPRSGRVVRLLKLGAGQTVSAGDVLAVIVPKTRDQAVELLVSDNDAPLVSVGRPVRLQFAGWPALQFAGWPSIAVGTFGGRVSVIDALDDGNNRYRILVRPDYEAIKKGKDDPWPSPEYLRPGAEVTGWVLLDQVSLGFELWRQFNAFPPTVNRFPVDAQMKSMDINQLDSKSLGVDKAGDKDKDKDGTSRKTKK